MTNSDSESVNSIVTALIQRQYYAGRQHSDADDSATLGRLLMQQALFEKLQQHLLQTLEFWVQTGAHVSHVRAEELVITCADGSAASRVRFMQNDILQAVQAYADKSHASEQRELLQSAARIRVAVRPDRKS